MKKQLDNIDSETTLQLKENKESAQTLSERSKNYVQSARVTSTKDKVNSAEFVPLVGVALISNYNDFVVMNL